MSPPLIASWLPCRFLQALAGGCFCWLDAGRRAFNQHTWHQDRTEAENQRFIPEMLLTSLARRPAAGDYLCILVWLRCHWHCHGQGIIHSDTLTTCGADHANTQLNDNLYCWSSPPSIHSVMGAVHSPSREHQSPSIVPDKHGACKPVSTFRWQYKVTCLSSHTHTWPACHTDTSLADWRVLILHMGRLWSTRHPRHTAINPSRWEAVYVKTLACQPMRACVLAIHQRATRKVAL